MLRIILILAFLCTYSWCHDSFNEGLIFFQDKKYDQALFVFKKSNEGESASIQSLLGQLFCHIALNHLSEIGQTALTIDERLSSASRVLTSKERPTSLEKQRVAYQCRLKVREVSNEMRQTVEKLVRDTVPGIFQKIRVLRQLYPLIDALERVAIDCCQSDQSPNCCLDPLLNELESWKSFGLTYSIKNN